MEISLNILNVKSRIHGRGIGKMPPRHKLVRSLIAVSVSFNELQPLKLFATKLQKRNQDIYQAYHMIDQVLKDPENIKSSITKEFKP